MLDDDWTPRRILCFRSGTIDEVYIMLLREVSAKMEGE